MDKKPPFQEVGGLGHLTFEVDECLLRCVCVCVLEEGFTGLSFLIIFTPKIKAAFTTRSSLHWPGSFLGSSLSLMIKAIGWDVQVPGHMHIDRAVIYNENEMLGGIPIYEEDYGMDWSKTCNLNDLRVTTYY
ncbi:hypothetical protein Tco_1533066 [Tanacetum coccineum]